MNEEVDLTIIGAGPVGMFAGFYAGLRELKVPLLKACLMWVDKLRIFTQRKPS